MQPFKYDLVLMALVSGLPSLPLSGGHHSSGPSGSAGKQYPITADFINKSQKMNTRTILIISSSAVVVLVVCIGAVIVLLNCRKDGRPSNAVRHAYTPSVNRRSGKYFSLVFILLGKYYSLVGDYYCYKVAKFGHGS